MKRALLATMLVGTLCAQVPANRRQFVACPIVRDTKAQPCWLAEYQGVTYYLGVQGGVANDFYPPQLEHEVLVEGEMTPGPKVCGGVPLRPVKVSVMTELNHACNTILPAEESVGAGIAIPAPRDGNTPTWVKRDGANKTTIFFDFDNDFLSLHSTQTLIAIAKRAVEMKAAKMEVVGQRASTLLSSGATMTEKADMGGIRARKVAEILVGLGVPNAAVKASAAAEAVKADGVNDSWNRRVVITVE